jgi:UDP-glucuronate decarboxylase
MVLSPVSRDSPKESSVSTAKGNGRSARTAPAAAHPVLVCGGAGFLGSHLCARLLARGERVICVDNFCTSEEESMAALLEQRNFVLLRRDVGTLQEGELGPLSAIFNFACAASPIHYQRSPLDTLFSSIRGMDTLLRIARRCRARIFQASTSEIYGHPAIHPQAETYWGYVNPMGPRSCYDEGKRCAETLCYIYKQQHGVPVRVARIFNTYGPGMRLTDGRVVINFIMQALAGEPLTVYGDGTQTRSFCYVDDLIDGVLRLMDAGDDFGPVNLGNPVEIRVLELAEHIIRLTGSRSPLLISPLPVDDPPRRRPDIGLALRALDWQPRTDLETGLKLTIRDVEMRLRLGEPQWSRSAEQLVDARRLAVGTGAP